MAGSTSSAALTCPNPLREFLTDHGLHESLEWDAYVHGVALVEAYLMALYERRTASPKPRSELRDWLKVLNLTVDGWPLWASFAEAREVRDSIVRRAGREDQVVHDSGIAQHQQVGERLRIPTTQARRLVDDLADLIGEIAGVLGDDGEPG